MNPQKYLLVALVSMLFTGELPAGGILLKKDGKSFAPVGKETPIRQFADGEGAAFQSAKSLNKVNGFGEFPEQLGPADFQFEDGSFYDAWMWNGAPGERIQVNMSSEEFDTMLLASNPDGVELERNDDEPTGTNSALEVSVPNNGQLVILANSYEAGATGAYTLSIQATSTCSCDSPEPDESIATIGEEMQGHLGPGSEVLGRDGTYLDRWTFEADAGQSVDISLKSNDFDSFLVLFDPSGNYLTEDDDGGEAWNSRIRYTIPRDGTYRIFANQIEAQEGDYLLKIDLQSPLAFATGGQPNEKYALIVGVADYPGTEFDLPLVANDVKVVSKMFITEFGIRPENIVVLENEVATRMNILSGIMKHLGQAGEDGTAVFYYSGHGTQTDGNVAIGPPIDEEADGMDEALVAFDELIVDDEIAFAMNQIRAEKLLVLFDSCHSGDATKDDGTAGMPKEVEYKQISKYIDLPKEYLFHKDYSDPFLGDGTMGIDSAVDGRLYIAASAEDEKSMVSEDLEMSVFTYFLVATIAQGKGQTFGEFVSELHELVTQYTETAFTMRQSSHLEASPASARVVIGEFFE